MPIVRKTLHSQNDVVGPILVTGEGASIATVQYVTGGGTIVLEMTEDDPLAANRTLNANAVWVTLKITDNTNTDVNNLAAPGSGRTNPISCRAFRIRLSAAAGADVDAILNVRDS